MYFLDPDRPTGHLEADSAKVTNFLDVKTGRQTPQATVVDRIYEVIPNFTVQPYGKRRFATARFPLIAHLRASLLIRGASRRGGTGPALAKVAAAQNVEKKCQNVIARRRFSREPI